MAKISDVAKLAGVSTATVSAVINDQDVVKPHTKRRVLAAIRKLDYHPNLYARSLARGRSAMLGLIISDIINPFFAEIAQIVQAEANRRGFQVFISATQFSLERLRMAVKHMIGMRADGLVIMTTEMDDETLDAIRARKMPVVFEDVGTVDETTSNIRIDYEGGIFRAVRCLTELGHKRILYVENAPAALEKSQMLSLRLRADAFGNAIERFPGIQAHVIVSPGPAFSAGVKAATEALRCDRFTGAVVNADPIALGFLCGLRRAGCRVPDDVSIIGFDNSPSCEMTEPPLTSVSIPREMIGKMAVETLLKMIEYGEPGCEIHIPTELVLRESAGRPPAPERRAWRRKLLMR